MSLAVDYGEPTKEAAEYAKEKLNEDVDTRAKVLEELRRLIYERGECPHECRTDDAFLLRFLRARYFHVKSSHRLLVNYFKFKEENPELHQNVNPRKMKYLGDDDVITISPFTDRVGRKFVYFKVGHWDPSSYSADEIFKATILILEVSLLEQKNQIYGASCIFDLDGLSLQHIWNLSPSMAKKIIEFIVSSFPIRLESLHVINHSWLYGALFSLFSPFLTDEMREIVRFHDSLESLHEYIDPKSLPSEYGGIQPYYTYNDWMDVLIQDTTVVDCVTKLGYSLAPCEYSDEEKEDDEDEGSN